MISLKGFMSDINSGFSRVILLYELVMKARNPQHKFFGNTEAELIKLALIEKHTGDMHDSIRNIVLSAVEGDGLNMRLVSPLAEDVTVSSKNGAAPSGQSASPIAGSEAEELERKIAQFKENIDAIRKWISANQKEIDSVRSKGILGAGQVDWFRSGQLISRNEKYKKDILEIQKDIQRMNEELKALKDKASSGSPMQDATKVGSSPMTPGGIDFRVMNIVSSPLIANSSLKLPAQELAGLAKVNLDELLGQIQGMLAAGTVPVDSLKQYVAACRLSGDWGNRKGSASSCLVETCRLLEDRVMETPQAIKEALVIADSDRLSG